MFYAEKQNKVVQIEEKDSTQYQALGYDIVRVDKNGKRELVYIGHGKTVPYSKYLDLKNELEKVKDVLTDAQLKKLGYKVEAAE